MRAHVTSLNAIIIGKPCWKRYFYTRRNNNIKCNLCGKINQWRKTVNPLLIKHLKDIHKVNESIAKFRKWLLPYFSETQCNAVSFFIWWWYNSKNID